MLLVLIVTVLLLLSLLLVTAAFLFNTVEYYFILLYKRPIYVHAYIRPKSLNASQKHILQHQFRYFTALPEKKQRYFEHRVVRFIEHYQFIGKEDFHITDEVKVLIAATSTMLTFGMRNYLYSVIDKVIVFPSVYFSTMSDDYHKGEFNPNVRAVVFSWEDFKKGFDTQEDNLNLGIHEFAHVLNYHGLKNSDASAILFSRMYRKINAAVNHPANSQRLIQSNYFRVYAYTNRFEFLAVVLEHFFETPLQFRQEFPELYQDIRLMLNYDAEHGTG